MPRDQAEAPMTVAEHDDSGETERVIDRVARLVRKFRIAAAKWRARFMMRQAYLLDEKVRFLTMLHREKMLWYLDAKLVAEGFWREVAVWDEAALPMAAAFLSGASQQQRRVFRREVLKKYHVPFKIILALHKDHGCRFTHKELAVRAFKDAIEERKRVVPNSWGMSFGGFEPDEAGERGRLMRWLYRPEAKLRLKTSAAQALA